MEFNIKPPLRLDHLIVEGKSCVQTWKYQQTTKKDIDELTCAIKREKAIANYSRPILVVARSIIVSLGS